MKDIRYFNLTNRITVTVYLSQVGSKTVYLPFNCYIYQYPRNYGMDIQGIKCILAHVLLSDVIYSCYRQVGLDCMRCPLNTCNRNLMLMHSYLLSYNQAINQSQLYSFAQLQPALMDSESYSYYVLYIEHQWNEYLRHTHSHTSISHCDFVHNTLLAWVS